MGGVQNLIINISRELNEKGLKAKVFGFKTCLIYMELVRLNVEFDFVDLKLVSQKNLKNYIMEDDVIVFGSYSPRFRLFNFRDSNPRILYWNVFANKLAIANRVTSFLDLKFRTKRLIKELVENNSVVFMDVYGIKAIEDSFGKNLISNINDLYLPIPVKTYNRENVFLSRQAKLGNEINITYVGRSSIWKMQPLKKIITDLAQLQTSGYIINVHIITQQPQDYMTFIRDVKLDGNIILHYHNDLVGENYRNFLINTSDIHFAMGTSALDAAVLGIPTVVIDYSSEEFPLDYKYLWLYDAEGYDLGHPVITEINPKSHSLLDIVSLYINLNQEGINLVSERTFKYVHDNHEISAVVDRLLIFASLAELRVRTMLKYTLINTFLIRLALRLIGKDVMQIYKSKSK